VAIDIIKKHSLIGAISTWKQILASRKRSEHLTSLIGISCTSFFNAPFHPRFGRHGRKPIAAYAAHPLILRF
jgi:hypothetical protein